MRKKILAFVFAAALLVAMAVPLFGSVGTASAGGRAGPPNGQSGNQNGFGVCHGPGDGAPLWLPNAKAQAAHFAHGDVVTFNSTCP